jgi:quercetin dioxygenase-like cupin family protein
MRLVRFDATRGRELDHHGSSGFRLTPLAKLADGHVVCVHLAPGGRIGRHPAAGPQLLAVVSGEGTVSGADGATRPIAAGVAAVWEPGEEHETRSEIGLTALVIEGAAVDVLAAP